ncbi:hypothetical protein SSAG_05557 [Streptomyces sp. Mg1]|nr:hypothetical protein SSAG_05557 [Streptomyces sp. Mg1]
MAAIPACPITRPIEADGPSDGKGCGRVARKGVWSPSIERVQLMGWGPW